MIYMMIIITIRGMKENILIITRASLKMISIRREKMKYITFLT